MHGLNWYKKRIGENSIDFWIDKNYTRRAAILEMVNENFELFPTLREIINCLSEVYSKIFSFYNWSSF